MVEISDQELTKLQEAFNNVLSALADQQSPEGQKVKELIVEAQQVVTAKLDKNATMAIGGGVVQKTKALFGMFHLGPRDQYQHEPTGGSVSVANKMVSDWKTKKNKQLFEMFHIGN